MEDVTNETIETTTEDNSDVQGNKEPENNTDNSENLNKEPDANGENINGQEENKGKFTTLEEATKSYAELQKKLGEQSNELGELRKIAETAKKMQEQIDAQKLQDAKNSGFETVKEFENHKEIVNYEVGEYSKHINECDFPEEMQNLLEQYQKTPSKELLDTIEAEFPRDVVKKVAGDIALLKGQLQSKENEALKEEFERSAREYLNSQVPKYSEDFKNPAFTEIYTEAFKVFGLNLETDRFVNLMHKYAEYAIKNAGIQKSIDAENNTATDEIAGLTNTSNAQPHVQEKNILDMTEEEIRKELKRIK